MTYNIGSVIKEVRERKKMDINQLAIESGLARSSLYNIESGQKRPNFETLKKISKGLNNYPISLLLLKALKEDKVAQHLLDIIRIEELGDAELENFI